MPSRRGARWSAIGEVRSDDRGKPLYMIGVVADMLKRPPADTSLYEKKGLVRPSRTVGRTRIYSTEDVDEAGAPVEADAYLG